jgi:hypothetical protein
MERIRLLREAHQQDVINAREAERRQKELIERKRKENELRKKVLADQRREPRNQVIISATPPVRANDPGRNRRISSVQKPPIPRQDQIHRISPKPREAVAKSRPLQVEGRVMSRSPKIPQEEAPKLPPRNNSQEEVPRQTPQSSAQERRKRYEQLKQQKVPAQGRAVPSPGLQEILLRLCRHHS